MRIFSKSDIGLVRSSNQDSCNADYFPGDSAWAVVCDGMGGSNGGDIASRVAVDVITEELKKHYEENMTNESIREMMEKSVYDANKKVYQRALDEPILKGMGTTVVLSLIIDNTLHIVYAGDSRAYIVNKENTVQITIDHSIVQQMINSGHLTETQAKEHPNRNIITRALGVDPDIKLDYVKYDLDDGDSVLICTDGLSNYIDSETICKFYNQFPMELLADELVFAAKKMGGSDNITVVVIDREIRQEMI